jgi:hypothetical protein
MAFLYVVLVLLAALAALKIGSVVRRRFARKALEQAKVAGVSIDDEGNIDAESSFAGMMLNEETTGKPFGGKQARFMELMRVVSEGPRNADEIRFLFEEGIGSVVRPDGVVYVPCIENEHLYMDGEIDLMEEDLDTYLDRENFLAEPVSTRAS